MIYSIIKKIIFKFDPELIHGLILQSLKYISNTPLNFLIKQSFIDKKVHCMGITFKNILGLAAGFDKNGKYIDVLDMMGFGFIEVGTVTPQAQYGNNKPRLFKLNEHEGLINNMGFNNLGVDNLIKNIKKSKFNGILGVNIGKNLSTPIEQSKDDYLFCMEKIYPYASYIAVNISSPNTPQLRTLQFGELLEDTLKAISYKKNLLQKKYKKYVPIVVKISPDITITELIKLADSLLCNKIDGVIATNTTNKKNLIKGSKYYNQVGGISGRPLQLISTQIINYLHNELQDKIPIIGVGGIDSLVSAREKIIAGASLIQIYSGLIFHGPKLLKNIINNI